MAKLTLTDVVTGVYSVQRINTNNGLIETALENTLSLDGTAPNQMTADLDLNGQALLNATLAFASYNVAGAPSASTLGAGAVIYVTDGDAGSPCLGVSNGTAWKVVALGSTISAS